MADNSDSSNNARRGRFATVTRYLSRYRGYLIIGGIAVVLSNALMLVTPLVTKAIFDHLESGKQFSNLLNLVLLLVGLSALSGFFRFMMRRTIIWMSRHLEYDLRGDIFGHLLKLTPSFYHNNRTGDIMARMTNDLEAVRQMVGPGIMYISNAVVNLVIGISVMIYLSPMLTLMASIPLILLPISVNRVANKMHVRSMRIQEHFSNLTAAAQENLSGIRVIKAYRQEKNEIKHFSDLSFKYIGLNMDLAKLYGLFFPLMRLMAGLSTLMVLYYGGREVMNNSITLGTMVAFFAYLGILMWPVIALGWVLSLYQRGTASLKRINSVLNTEPLVRSDGKDSKRTPIRGEIEFKNLRFAYNSTPVLNGIDLHIRAGETVGIVGPTGSGKTTLVSLLARLFPVPEGQLLIDGIDINEYNLDELRSRIGFATQEPFLFSDTLAENVRFGNETAENNAIESAAQTAVLDKDVIDFRNGYQTMVGERGITLSGGQKQRTAIARAIMIDPSILILDDATSAVDTETEHEINERIKDVLRGRTSLIISHRISAVKDADQIIYLDDGRIVEQGDHDELIAKNGRYAELYRTQLLAEELERL